MNRKMKKKVVKVFWIIMSGMIILAMVGLTLAPAFLY